MKVTPIPSDAAALPALAEAIATVLSEKRDELDIRTDVEALLRARIAAASPWTDRPLFSHAADKPLTLNERTNHAKNKTEHHQAISCS